MFYLEMDGNENFVVLKCYYIIIKFASILIHCGFDFISILLLTYLHLIWIFLKQFVADVLPDKLCFEKYFQLERKGTNIKQRIDEIWHYVEYNSWALSNCFLRVFFSHSDHLFSINSCWT